MANEKRLIDVEQAKRATYEEIFWSKSEQAVVRNFLAKLPKVDAVEVVHGRWVDTEDGETVCSNCEIRIPEMYSKADTVIKSECRFCHYCGAKMDGDGNGS